MEGILTTFGIDTRLIIIQLVNFFLLLAALWYFLYEPIMKMLATREEKITQGVADAEAAKIAKADAAAEKQTIVTAAHQEAESITKRATSYADEKAGEIVTEANTKASAILTDAAQKGEELKQKAHKESEAEIAKVAILAAEKILREKTS